MTQDPSHSKAADRGKGKAEDEKRAYQAQKGKKDGKDEAKPAAEELTEEDQKLKDELDMLVERLTETNISLHKPALEQMKTLVKTSTSSVTAVPKPLKFLRPHYKPLTDLYEKWPTGDDKRSLADVLSVIGMTYSDDDQQDTLIYRLQASSQDIASWGHEYVRHLALEIGKVYEKRLAADEQTEDLIELGTFLVPLFLKANAEADAVDLMSELEMMERLPEFVDENTYSRVCLYVVSMINLLPYPDNELFLRVAYTIYKQYKQYTQAMTLALRLGDKRLIEEDFWAAPGYPLKKQLAFMIARERIWIEVSQDCADKDDEELTQCLDNTRMREYYQLLGKELNILEAKTTEDIYKSHLESNRVAGMTNYDSARNNLAAAFVNAFVNAGFGKDQMVLTDASKDSWVWKTKDEGQLSTVASIGSLLLWGLNEHIDTIDVWDLHDEDQVNAGAQLAFGVMSAGIRLEHEPGLAFLGDHDKLYHKNPLVRVATIMGLGLAYAGTCKDDVFGMMEPMITNPAESMQVAAMAALTCGVVYVGSADPDVSQAIVGVLLGDDRASRLTDKWTRFLALGLGLLFFGRQEEVEVILETLKAVEHPMAKPTATLAEICAWAGTGAVLKIQELLRLCTEHQEESEEKKGDELLQANAVLGIALVGMGEDIGADMVLRHFGHLMHYGEPNIRRAVPLAMGLLSASNPQMKVYDTLSRYSHDNDGDVALNAIFAMGMVGAGTNNARLAQLLRQLASYYHRDQEMLFMVRIAQALLHMGKGTLTISPFHTDRQVLSKVSSAGLLSVIMAMTDAKLFITTDAHYLVYYLVLAMQPRFLITLDEKLKPLTVNVRVGQAVDVVGQAGRPKTITGWQTQSTPVLLAHGERAELEDDEYISYSSVLEGVVILRKNPDFGTDN